MNTLFGNILIILFAVQFFGFSVFCIYFWLKTPRSNLKALHWSMQAAWYWGVSYACILVIAFFSSFIVYLAMQM